MKFAYADPPYPGCAHYYLKENPNASEVDHKALIERLVAEFPDGWALSTHVAGMKMILPWCPPDVRVAAWCKPFAAWKIPKNEDGKAAAAPYAWEPVIFRTSSRAERAERMGVFCRDFLLESPPMKQRVPGEKPHRFGWWVFSLLGAGPGDEMHDLFPGSGAIGEAWEAWNGRWDTTGTLFDPYNPPLRCDCQQPAMPGEYVCEACAPAAPKAPERGACDYNAWCALPKGHPGPCLSKSEAARAVRLEREPNREAGGDEP